MSTSITSLTGRNARIAVAATWAKLFVHEAENALKGSAHELSRAAAQTVMAIEAIGPKLPCDHDDFYRHERTGVCVHPDCV
jgi:hypothetical protein